MLIHRIRLTDVLSFGPSSQELKLGPLNVVIGPNGSGKSNLIEAIGLLKAAPRDLHAPIRDWRRRAGLALARRFGREALRRSKSSSRTAQTGHFATHWHFWKGTKDSG